MLNPTTIENIDLLIIGAGPAGLAAAVEAQRGGISNLLVVEKGPSHSQMIRTYYKEGKRVDAQYAGVEALCFGILCLRDGNRESYLAMMDYVIESCRIPIRYNTEIWSVMAVPGTDAFDVRTASGLRYLAKFVIVAIGKMGRPRQPDYYREIPAVLKNEKRILFDINTRSFDGAKILVVGGGDSAAEYAQMLSVKNEVTLSYRQATFTRLNSINEKIVSEMIAQKKFRALMPSNIVKIERIRRIHRHRIRPHKFEEQSQAHSRIRRIKLRSVNGRAASTNRAGARRIALRVLPPAGVDRGIAFSDRSHHC
jgi:thioredoxin reductase (NADPH)